MKRNTITVKLTGRTFFQKSGGRMFWSEGVSHYERILISKGCLTREMSGLEIREAFMGVGPLDAPSPRLSVAKQELKFVTCGHVPLAKVKRLVENVLGIDSHDFTLRVVKC